VPKKSGISYILACHLQIYVDPDPAYHFQFECGSGYATLTERVGEFTEMEGIFIHASRLHNEDMVTGKLVDGVG
jgi:hypothetical protein